MGARQEAVVRSWFDRMVALDLESALDHFADDATYHVAAWYEPLTGREAVRAGLEREFRVLSSEYRYTIRNMASTDDVVFMEIVDEFKSQGKNITMHWSSVLEINQAGKITTRRDYWDAKEYDARIEATS